MLTLGVNYSHKNDSSACNAWNGEPLFVAVEEVLNRVEHDACLRRPILTTWQTFSGTGAQSTI